MNPEEWNPGRLLETSGAYWKTCTLHAAVKLDVFTAIGDHALTCGDIARKLAADTEGLCRLLNALTAMKLLAKAGETFSNTPASRSFLSKDSEAYIGYMIMHHHHLVDGWRQLDQAVKTGKPVRPSASHDNETVREHFLMGMFNNAMNLAPRLIPQIDLSDRTRLLDLGGGPGTYAIHFCLRYPQLRASVFDLPTTETFARKTIERFNLSDRIAFIGGDFLNDPLEGSYDIVWLSHILHGENADDCRKIIGKAVTALVPGGRIIIHEFILNDTLDGPLFPTLFSLNMLLGTPGGQSYSEKHLKDMLAEAGVKNIRRIPVQTPNDSGMIAGEI
jgi:SAM-dependent methyltransferase